MIGKLRLVALALSVVAGIGMLSACGNNVDVVPFAGQMADYVSAPVSGTGSKRLVIRPRLVVVEPRTEAMDTDVFGDLPDDLRAATPDEVGTVVRTRWRNTLIGRWSTGAQKYGYECEVTVIDWKTKRVVARKDFHGMDNATSDGEESRFTHRFAVNPTEKIVDYLAGIPRT